MSAHRSDLTTLLLCVPHRLHERRSPPAFHALTQEVNSDEVAAFGLAEIDSCSWEQNHEGPSTAPDPLEEGSFDTMFWGLQDEWPPVFYLLDPEVVLSHGARLKINGIP
eukprot:FR735858.1.p2 GENE.FR735858.1~~FR735858.1.p2  ORF type:complete len:109 (-),score=14.97 FR735858.1:94-420(-)